MNRKKTGLIPAAAMVLLVLCIVPAAGAAAVGDTDYSWPVLDNAVVTRQAHLTWAAAIKETEMSATIAYIGTLNGTGAAALSSLLSDFQAKEAQIGTISTHVGLNNLVRQMQEVIRQFRTETRTQMTAGSGKYLQLTAQVKAAVDANANLKILEDTYWSTRQTNELASFDLYVEKAGNVLTSLSAKGYDTNLPQATLDSIRAKRGELQSALQARDRGTLQSIQQSILILSQQLSQQVRDLQVKVPEERRLTFWIDEGNRATARADMINADLKALGIDTSTLEPILARAKSDLAAAQQALTAGDLTGARTALQKAGQDFRDLAAAYRALVSSGKAPDTATGTVNSFATALETTAGNMGGA